MAKLVTKIWKGVIFGLLAVSFENARSAPVAVPVLDQTGRQSEAHKLFSTTVQRYLEYSTDLAKERMSVRESESSLRSRELFWTPSLELEFGKTKQSLTLSEGSWDPSKGVTASLNLFKFGADLKLLNAAKALNRREQHSYRQTQFEAENKIANLIFGRTEVAHNLDIAKRTLELKSESVKIAEIRYKQGKLPEQEVDKIKLDRESASNRVESLKEQEILLVQQFKEYNLPDLTNLDWPWMNTLSANWKLQWKAPEQHPLTQMLEADYLAQESLETAYHRMLLPSLDFKANWQNNRLDASTDNGLWTMSLVLTVPIWNQLKGWGQYQLQSEKKAYAELDWERSRRQLEQSLSKFQTRFEIRRATALSALAAVQKSTSFYRDSLRSFQLGRATVNDLFIEQSRLYEAETAAEAAVRKYHEILIESCHLKNQSILEECL